MFETIGYLLICWLAADFMSGFWHWLEDRYFDTEWPIIGKYIAKPNRLHHDQPIALHPKQLLASQLYRHPTRGSRRFVGLGLSVLAPGCHLFHGLASQ